MDTFLIFEDDNNNIHIYEKSAQKNKLTKKLATNHKTSLRKQSSILSSGAIFLNKNMTKFSVFP